MSTPSNTNCWWHWIISTRGSWLHGDQRGFRSRRHRLHSSGDYKHRPPADEHAGLRQFHQQRSAKPMIIPPTLREQVGRAILRKIRSQRSRVIIIAVSGMHAHGITQLATDRGQVKRVIGTWKQASSHAIRTEFPGRIWAEGSDPVPIKNHEHQVNAFNYILEHEEHGAWLWTFQDESWNESHDDGEDKRQSEAEYFP